VNCVYFVQYSVTYAQSTTMEDACMKHTNIEFKFNTMSFLNLSISKVEIFKLTLTQLTYLRR